MVRIIIHYLLFGGAAHATVQLNIIVNSRWKLPLIESIEIFIILLAVAVAFGDSGALDVKLVNDFTIVFNHSTFHAEEWACM